MDMSKSNVHPIAAILGWIVIIIVPTAFFIFGWRSIDIQCLRLSPKSPATCSLTESFAAGLFKRNISTENVVNIHYKSHSSKVIRSGGTGSQTVLTSSLAFIHQDGTETALSKVSSNVDSEAQKKLILSFRENNESGALQWKYHGNFRNIFGYLGLIGVVFLIWAFYATLKYFIGLLYKKIHSK